MYIPFWITNCVFLATCVMAGYQHQRLNRENPVTNLQFMVIVFSMLMIVVILLYGRDRTNAWLSLGFFLVAAATFFLTLRQQRMLPYKSFE